MNLPEREKQTLCIISSCCKGSLMGSPVTAFQKWMVWSKDALTRIDPSRERDREVMLLVWSKDVRFVFLYWHPSSKSLCCLLGIQRTCCHHVPTSLPGSNFDGLSMVQAWACHYWPHICGYHDWCCMWVCLCLERRPGKKHNCWPQWNVQQPFLLPHCK